MAADGVYRLAYGRIRPAGSTDEDVGCEPAINARIDGMDMLGSQRHCGERAIAPPSAKGTAGYCKRDQTPPYEAHKGEAVLGGRDSCTV